MVTRKILLFLALALVLPGMMFVTEADGKGPIIATGAQRRAIKSKPIIHRQDRPLHFYGNTIRRINRLRRR